MEPPPAPNRRGSRLRFRLPPGWATGPQIKRALARSRKCRAKTSVKRALPSPVAYKPGQLPEKSAAKGRGIVREKDARSSSRLAERASGCPNDRQGRTKHGHAEPPAIEKLARLGPGTGEAFLQSAKGKKAAARSGFPVPCPSCPSGVARRGPCQITTSGRTLRRPEDDPALL